MDSPGLQWWISTTTTSGRERQLLLENYPALMLREWLPPEEEWPELRELRAEHERLLDACDEALAAAVRTNAKFRVEEEKQEAETAAAIREGRKEKTLKATPPEEQRRRRQQNIRRIEAAV